MVNCFLTTLRILNRKRESLSTNYAEKTQNYLYDNKNMIHTSCDTQKSDLIINTTIMKHLELNQKVHKKCT